MIILTTYIYFITSSYLLHNTLFILIKHNIYSRVKYWSGSVYIYYYIIRIKENEGRTAVSVVVVVVFFIIILDRCKTMARTFEDVKAVIRWEKHLRNSVWQEMCELENLFRKLGPCLFIYTRVVSCVTMIPTRVHICKKTNAKINSSPKSSCVSRDSL